MNVALIAAMLTSTVVAPLTSSSAPKPAPMTAQRALCGTAAANYKLGTASAQTTSLTASQTSGQTSGQTKSQTSHPTLGLHNPAPTTGTTTAVTTPPAGKTNSLNVDIPASEVSKDAKQRKLQGKLKVKKSSSSGTNAGENTHAKVKHIKSGRHHKTTV